MRGLLGRFSAWPDIMENMNEIFDCWRKLAIKNGFNGLKIASQFADINDLHGNDSRIDYFIEYQPNFAARWVKGNIYNKLKKIKKGMVRNLGRIFKTTFFTTHSLESKLEIRDYDTYWKAIINHRPDSVKSIPGGFVDWDNTPRKGKRGSVFLNSDKSVRVSSGIFMVDKAYDLNVIGKYDFDNVNDDPFIVPDKIANNGNSNLILYPDGNSVNNQWSFSFTLDGIIGPVTATSSNVSYSSSDDNPVWWHYDQYGNKIGQRVYSQNPTTGTLQDALNTLTGKPGIKAPGLLTDSSSGGMISIDFDLKDAGGKNLGRFSINVNVRGDDTELKVSDRITGALNKDTILDLYTPGDHAYFSSYSYYSGQVEVPVYGTTILRGRENFWVQAGAEAGQHIDIEYESLSLYALGMQDTDTLTVESASRAINEVKGALQVVSDQRSLFGAYQNRLEHAYNINKNVEENTQASESLIRDTDIADAMMEYSINNILLQAGTSMLTQANQSSQLITQLLG